MQGSVEVEKYLCQEVENVHWATAVRQVDGGLGHHESTRHSRPEFLPAKSFDG